MRIRNDESVPDIQCRKDCVLINLLYSQIYANGFDSIIVRESFENETQLEKAFMLRDLSGCL